MGESPSQLTRLDHNTSIHSSFSFHSLLYRYNKLQEKINHYLHEMRVNQYQYYLKVLVEIFLVVLNFYPAY